MTTIVEDRVLARVARDAVAWDDGAPADRRAEIAFGRAVVALRVMGVGLTPQMADALREDIALAAAGAAAPRRPAPPARFSAAA